VGKGHRGFCKAQHDNNVFFCLVVFGRVYTCGS
jgi:hypothetical protein